MSRSYMTTVPLLLKCVALFTLGGVTLTAVGDEYPYTRSTARHYLSGKPNVVVAMKIAGAISIGEYSAWLHEFADESVDDELLFSRWQEYFPVDRDHRLVILRTLKGNLSGVIDLPADTYGIYVIPLGHPVLLFLDNVERPSIDYCDVVSADKFPAGALKAASLDDVIRSVVEEGLSLCARIPD